jgi:glycerophosphoryl diester phosphodiesterase
MKNLPATITPHLGVAFLSTALAQELKKVDLENEGNRPCAVIALYSRKRHEIWRVGDCPIAVNRRSSNKTKKVDQINAQTRRLFLIEMLGAGVSINELCVQDPGLEFIRPLIQRQHLFRNQEGAGVWAYGAIDGHPVPASLMEVFPVPRSGEVVLTTDGYLRCSSTVAKAETLLRRVLSLDPLLIGPGRASTKGLVPGQVSFDDRTYLRLIAD